MRRLLKEVKNRPAARFLNDVEIPADAWKPDFDLADRYQGFANELMRIALLGIGGYGFLIKEIISKNKPLCSFIKDSYVYLCIGAISLGICLVFVLAHRFYSTFCLYYQLLIVRSLKRFENSHWSDVEKEKERLFLKDTRDTQRQEAYLSRRILIGASVFFAIGFLFVVVVFVRILLLANNI